MSSQGKEFTSPQSTKPPTRESRVDSDTTMCETEGGSSLEPQLIDDERKEPLRPSLIDTKYQTETPKPAGRRSIITTQRRATGAHKVEGEFLERSTSPDSLDSWSSDEDSTVQLRRTRTSPSSDGLSPAPEEYGPKSRLRRVFSYEDPDGEFSIGNDHFRTRGRVSTTDGRLNISVHDTANRGYLAKALGTTIKRHFHAQDEHKERSCPVPGREAERSGSRPGIPKLNIVIMVIGSRGDIQPFLKIGKILKEKHGHKVRIATHPVFKSFVEKEIGLEFFSVGGDPSELMAFMVKNPGLIPSVDTVMAGEIGRRRYSMFEMFQGFWRACINATDDEKDVTNLKMMGDKYPFVADAIIANPPSFAHFHCAERLGIPLHLVFTFPYSPTQAFPHPLANIKATNVDQNYTNFMSYPLVDLMTWQGLGDLVNRFRIETLGLEPVSTLWAPGQLSRLKVPTTYLWSPSLVPKPKDWGPEIEIAGYVFLDLASTFRPPDSLSAFLKDREKPIIYVGFGSISGLENPTAFAQMIFDAVEKANVRALVSRGWGGMGDGMEVPESVYLLDNIPHDWLFPQVDAVVHHGGAGTTAIGLKCGKPTMIIPFFGDQPFWSAMIVKAGAGAKQSLGLKKLTVEKFAEGIRQCLTPEAKEKAAELAASIQKEGDGAENAVNSFHRSLPLEGNHSMRCSILEDRVAVWNIKKTELQLSALAAEILVEAKYLKWEDLHLQRHNEWHDFKGPGEPITGAGGALLAAFHQAFLGIAGIPGQTKKDMAIRDRQKRKKQRRTVADVMVLPGRIAHDIHANPLRGASFEAGASLERANLSGEASPPKIRNFFSCSKRLTDPMTEPEFQGMQRVRTEDLPPVPSAPVTVARSAAKGLGHSMKAIITLPNDLWYALALGFRNAPRLYGDDTVRPPPHTITNFRSGLRTAGSELWLGFYDGFKGLVMLPYHDIKEAGPSGLATGIGKGVGGLVLKPMSGAIGVWAYTWKGARVGLRNRVRDTRRTERWIRRARMIQGAKDVGQATIPEPDTKKTSTTTTTETPLAHDPEQLRSRVLNTWVRLEQEEQNADGEWRQQKSLLFRRGHSRYRSNAKKKQKS